MGDREKIRSDLVFSYVGFLFLAISGLLTNVIISALYGATALGVFNQVFAVYIVVSQFSALGLHYSVLKHFSHEPSPDKRSEILGSSLLISGALSFILSVGVYLYREKFGQFMGSPFLGTAIAVASPGIFLFPLNKILIASLNGSRRIKAMTLCQVARCVGLTAGVLVSYYRGFEVAQICIAFTVGESLVFLTATACLLVTRVCLMPRITRSWLVKNSVFGLKGFLSGALLELNSRIDVLMIGYFLSDRQVGIYSFAAIGAEGFAQILVVLKANLNPIMGKLIHENRMEALYRLISLARVRIYLGMALLGLLAIGAFPWLAGLLGQGSEFMGSWPVLIVLVTGIVGCSGFLAFDNLFIQGGKPGYQTLWACLTVLSNSLLNLLLIPSFGILGAAIATSLSYVFGSFYLVTLLRRQMDIRLIQQHVNPWPDFWESVFALGKQKKST